MIEWKRTKDAKFVDMVPYLFRHKRYHITYPINKFRICSVIEHDRSYGREQDLLEIKGLLTKNEKKYDDVIGYLSAEEVFKRIQKNWKKLRRCLND